MGRWQFEVLRHGIGRSRSTHCSCSHLEPSYKLAQVLAHVPLTSESSAGNLQFAARATRTLLVCEAGRMDWTRAEKCRLASRRGAARSCLVCASTWASRRRPRRLRSPPKPPAHPKCAACRACSYHQIPGPPDQRIRSTESGKVFLTHSSNLSIGMIWARIFSS